MNSIYTDDDPWENGWASTDPQPHDSTLITPSQLLSRGTQEAVPDSYHQVRTAVEVYLVDDVQSLLQKLVDADVMSSFQTSRIMDLVYNHSLTPANETGFNQILGLIALEVEAPGSADYVTLQFKMASQLPELPASVVEVLVKTDDPLSAQLAQSLLDEWKPPLPKKAIEAMAEPPKAPDADVDQSLLSKEIGQLRDRFKPLFGTPEVKIKEVPEKGGVLFKHINYIITHNLKLGMTGPAGQKKVIRRYLDFVWLLEFLLKKYPFRVIPGLPPKKFSGMCLFGLSFTNVSRSFSRSAVSPAAAARPPPFS